MQLVTDGDGVIINILLLIISELHVADLLISVASDQPPDMRLQRVQTAFGVLSWLQPHLSA